MKAINSGDTLGVLDGYMDAGYVEGIQEYWTGAEPKQAGGKVGFDIEAKSGRDRVPVRVIVIRR